MSRDFDLVVIGAGPAGMSAAIRATGAGLRVLVVDEQAAPGGQIWRSIEAMADSRIGRLLGRDYQSGLAVARHFRSCGAELELSTQVWQVEPGLNIYMSRDHRAERITARNLLLATGAQERPAPFPGWTLPGVLTVGAAQILLKSSRQVPDVPVWIVGSGPLPMLYMVQLLRAGGTIAGWLDTSPDGSWRNALPHLWRARKGWRELLKGMGWMLSLRTARFPVIRGVKAFRALGLDRVEEIEFETASGAKVRRPAAMVLNHEGVVPSIHMSQSLGCDHVWSPAQQCFSPSVDAWQQTSVAGVYAAGDGAGIGGAKAACTRGELAGLGIALRSGCLSEEDAGKMAMPLRRRLSGELSTRSLLDAMFPPHARIRYPTDETIVCRCERLTAGEVRSAAAIGEPGLNQLKSFTRAGMGPCQGRQCAYSIGQILSVAQNRSAEQIGFYRVRPPLRSVTVAEMASLE